uniref:ABC transporter ATP-binding protein n=1 Tax=Pseudanabaena sp. UWO311 TaxID=2487337 RepID=UPI0021E008FF|nr:polysaccharide ABC transporter ATP-binding protein [Pseudanabaena sp. UWO311]
MEEAIRLDQVCLWRRTQEEFSYNLKKTVLSVFEGQYQQPAKKLVLDKIDLVVEKGEKIGIIGSNGAGKSTLLKVISGILKPTTGTVRVRGQIAPLIELGAGFDPEISVVDNILLYGVLLGLSREEMKERIESILDFADLEDYRFVPVKGLSSGMVARLGFAIATDVKPDILILDEVLSVGDESFKNKCQKRIDKFWEDHVTILVVSHSMEFIAKSCDKAIWLNKGHINLSGDAETVIKSYLVSAVGDDLESSSQTPEQSIIERIQSIEFPISSDEVTIHEFSLTQKGVNVSEYDGGKTIDIKIGFEIEEDLTLFRMGIFLRSITGECIFRHLIADWKADFESLKKGRYICMGQIPPNLIAAGSYIIELHSSRYGIKDYSFGDLIRALMVVKFPYTYNTAHTDEQAFGSIIINSNWQLTAI